MYVVFQLCAIACDDLLVVIPSLAKQLGLVLGQCPQVHFLTKHLLKESIQNCTFVCVREMKILDLPLVNGILLPCCVCLACCCSPTPSAPAAST